MRVKIPNVNLHKNPSDGSADTRKERDDETCSRHMRCERTKHVTLNAIRIFSDFLNITQSKLRYNYGGLIKLNNNTLCTKICVAATCPRF
jgi:hypothetical protein